MRLSLLGKYRNCVFMVTGILLGCYTGSFLYVSYYQNQARGLIGSQLSWIGLQNGTKQKSGTIQKNAHASYISKLTSSSASSGGISSQSPNASYSEDVVYHGHDLLKDVPFTFDRRFKNPCWYDGYQLKCLPYFYIIGVKKCGTSELFGKIIKHPEVVGPSFKEAQFYARGRFRPEMDDIDIYVQKFAQAAHIINQESEIYFQNNKINPLVTGEGSPSNLHLNSHWMYLPGNEHLSEPRFVILDYIRHFVPNAKLIITFRDPIDRLYSDYYHEYGTLRRDNHPNPQQFHDIVVAAIEMYKECFQNRTVRSCVYEPEYYKKTKIQVQLGIYYVYWEELLRVFPREQILVIQNKNISTIETYRRIYSFLGVRQLPERILQGYIDSRNHGYVRKSVFRAEGSMMNSTFNILYDFYKPFNEKMAEITHDSSFLYSHDIA